MPRIAPFRALRFDSSRLPDTAAVIAPPYDVISPEQRAVLEAQHPRNIVHLDLPRGEGDAKYENARTMLDAWLAEGSLREDSEPAIYRYEQIFSFDTGTGARSYTRKGFFALIQLSPFADRVVFLQDGRIVSQIVLEKSMEISERRRVIVEELEKHDT